HSSHGRPGRHPKLACPRQPVPRERVRLAQPAGACCPERPDRDPRLVRDASQRWLLRRTPNGNRAPPTGPPAPACPALLAVTNGRASRRHRAAAPPAVVARLPAERVQTSTPRPRESRDRRSALVAAASVTALVAEAAAMTVGGRRCNGGAP